MIWTARIAGMPAVKRMCFVLCRNVYIPRRIPKLPPAAATVNRVDSEMRHLFFLAFCLSTSISTKAAALIRIRNRYAIVILESFQEGIV